MTLEATPKDHLSSFCISILNSLFVNIKGTSEPTFELDFPPNIQRKRGIKLHRPILLKTDAHRPNQ